MNSLYKIIYRIMDKGLNLLGLVQHTIQLQRDWGRIGSKGCLLWHVDGACALQAKWGSYCLTYMAKSINCTSHYFPYSDHSKTSSSQKIFKKNYCWNLCLIISRVKFCISTQSSSTILVLCNVFLWIKFCVYCCKRWQQLFWII